MNLYKAETKEPKNYSGLTYFAFSPQGAYAWGLMLFGKTSRFYIHEMISAEAPRFIYGEEAQKL